MPGRIEVPDANVVDIAKRYDVYVTQSYSRDSVVVFRNAFFRGGKALEGSGRRADLWNDFTEIEQSDGSSVFVRKYAIMYFCEAGTKLTCEPLSPAG